MKRKKNKKYTKDKCYAVYNIKCGTLQIDAGPHINKTSSR